MMTHVSIPSRPMSDVGERNLGLLARRSFERRGDYPALLFEGRWHHSGELWSRSERLAAGLAELGVAPGDRVVVCMANCPEVSIAYQALWLAGAVVTPATFLLPPRTCATSSPTPRPRAVITTPEFIDKVTEATEGLEHVRFVICTEATGSADDVLALADLERADPRPIVAALDDDLAALLYTGGTTGRAKGVMLSHANLYFSGGPAHDAAHVPGINRQLTTLPLSHAYGLLVTIAGMHNSEQGVNVLLRWFDPAAYLALIAEHRLQLSAVVPTMLQILLGHAAGGLRPRRRSRYLSSGGAPLAPEVEQEFCRRVPSVSIRQGYGLTESAALISTNPTGAGGAARWAARCRAPRSRSATTDGRAARARRGRRGVRPLARDHAGLLARARGDERGARRTAGCTPATSATSTPRATSTSSTARRT